LEGGDAFISEDHLYSKDLDLFGHGSLYQVLCSARTQIGRETLARWMMSAAKREEIEARNAAVRELRPRRDLPERLAAAGVFSKYATLTPKAGRKPYAYHQGKKYFLTFSLVEVP
jgi:DNA mismatch repair ATPase MutS